MFTGSFLPDFYSTYDYIDMLLYLLIEEWLGASKLDWIPAILSTLCYMGVWDDVKAACFEALEGPLLGFAPSKN